MPVTVGEVYVPGLWRCAKCNFRLVQKTLNADSGTVTSNDVPGTKCPNDGSPMWRVTWKERALEAEEQLDSLIEAMEAQGVRIIPCDNENG